MSWRWELVDDETLTKSVSVTFELQSVEGLHFGFSPDTSPLSEGHTPPLSEFSSSSFDLDFIDLLLRELSFDNLDSQSIQQPWPPSREYIDSQCEMCN